MKCSLRKIVISNYKSIDKVSVELHDELSILIGKNGSGKTVFLSSIMLLKEIYLIHLYGERHQFGSQDIEENAQEAEEAGTSLKAVFELENGSMVFYSGNILINERTETRFRSRDLIRIRSETWQFQMPGKERSVKINHPNIMAIEKSNLSPAAYFYREKEGQATELDDDMVEAGNALYDHISLVAAVGDYIKGFKYYTATKFSMPSKCPSSFEVDEGRYMTSSSEHKNFLMDLYRLYTEDKNLFKVYKDIVCDPRLGLISGISFAPHELPTYNVRVKSGGKISRRKTSRRIIVPLFTKDSYTLSPEHLSEGTFKTLALLFYVISNTSSTLLIEEPEVCIHHGLLNYVLGIVKSNAEEKQVVITTHSEAVLDCIEVENLFAVTWRDGTHISKLLDTLGASGLKSLKEYLSSDGNLGEYLRIRDVLDE